MRPASAASAAKEPTPGSAIVRPLTEMNSEAERKNQAPPMLIIAFQMSCCRPKGTSSVQNRCQRVRRKLRAISSSSAGSPASDW